MKLRLKNNSVRLRIARSELARFIAEGRIEETVYFAPDERARLTYALAFDDISTTTQIVFQPLQVTMILPRKTALSWAESDDVGIYENVDLGVRGTLEVIVEKDFACLDLSDEENADTFPNPNAGTFC